MSSIPQGFQEPQPFGNTTQDQKAYAAKMAKKIASLGGEFVGKDVDTVARQLLDRAGITDELISKEAHLLNVDPPMAKLLILNRIFTRLMANLGIEKPEHTPSLVYKQEQTGLSYVVMNDVEKCFKRAVKEGLESKVHIAEAYNVFYSEHAGVVVELKGIDMGKFKLAAHAIDYFAALGENRVVTLRPIVMHAGESPRSMVHQSTSTTSSMSDASSDTTSSSVRSSIDTTEEDEVAPRDLPVTERAKKAVAGEYPLEDLSLDELRAIHAHDGVDELIKKRIKDRDMLFNAVPLTAQDRYDKEVALIEKLQQEIPEAIIKLHKVMNLGTNSKVMVMSEATYTLEPNEAHPEKVSVSSLASLVDLYLMGSLSKEETAWMMQLIGDAMDALALLHARGYIHRDIKENNFLIAQDGRCKIADFGATVALDADPDKFMLAGSPGYLAPEAAYYAGSERWDNLSEKSDVWSMGMMLYSIFNKGSILTHKVFDGLDDPAAIIDHLRGYEDASAQAAYTARYPEPQDPNSLDHLIWSATQLDPRKRPSIADLAHQFKVGSGLAFGHL